MFTVQSSTTPPRSGKRPPKARVETEGQNTTSAAPSASVAKAGPTAPSRRICAKPARSPAWRRWARGLRAAAAQAPAGSPRPPAPAPTRPARRAAAVGPSRAPPPAAVVPSPLTTPQKAGSGAGGAGRGPPGAGGIRAGAELPRPGPAGWRAPTKRLARPRNAIPGGARARAARQGGAGVGVARKTGRRTRPGPRPGTGHFFPGRWIFARPFGGGGAAQGDPQPLKPDMNALNLSCGTRHYSGVRKQSRPMSSTHGR